MSVILMSFIVNVALIRPREPYNYLVSCHLSETGLWVFKKIIDQHWPVFFKSKEIKIWLKQKLKRAYAAL